MKKLIILVVIFLVSCSEDSIDISTEKLFDLVITSTTDIKHYNHLGHAIYHFENTVAIDFYGLSSSQLEEEKNLRPAGVFVTNTVSPKIVETITRTHTVSIHN